MKMKNIFFAVLLCTAGCFQLVQAQSYRVRSLADTLVQQTGDLADRTYTDFSNRSGNSRGDVEAVVLANQLSASAVVFQRMVGDRRSSSELADAAGLLSDLMNRAPASGSNSYLWRDASRTMRDIGRELNIGGGGGGGNNGGGGGGNNGGDFPGGGSVIGRVRWRGTVDDESHLVIRGDILEVRTISGSDYGQGSPNFTSALPNRRVRVEVVQAKGRGTVNVIQQPSRDNDYTAIIAIRDGSGGARQYDVEVAWRRGERE